MKGNVCDEHTENADASAQDIRAHCLSSMYDVICRSQSPDLRPVEHIREILF